MNRATHRAPTVVRATHVLKHVAAGLATILVVGVVGVIGSRVGAPDVPSRVGASPTRVFPDPLPSVVPVPVTVAPTPTPTPSSAVVEPQPVMVLRPVVTSPPPQSVIVVVQDPTPAALAPEPEPVLLAPQEPVEPPKPAKTTRHRQRWDTHAQTPRQDPETTQPGQDTGLCAVVCVQLGDEQGDQSHE